MPEHLVDIPQTFQRATESKTTKSENVSTMWDLSGGTIPVMPVKKM